MHGISHGRIVAGLGAGGAVLLIGFAGLGAARQPDDPSVPTTLADFYFPGSQEGQINEQMFEAGLCGVCHGYYNEDQELYRPWVASMMGQGARDPIFWAALAVAEQAAPYVGDLCIRCHAARGWIVGHSQPTNGSGLSGHDFEGISCSVCHRMVDPVYRPGISPPVDEQVLAGLARLPVGAHSSQYVIDPEDRRRGPFDLGQFYWHQWEQSPFHTEARMCGTCHDVSNPLFTMDGNGKYVFNATGQPHPTHEAYDQFPLERTYSEWRESAFGRGPVDMGGRFGGNRAPLVSTCQDCHMPTTTGTACDPLMGGRWRENLPRHDFRGATTWMLRSVRNLYPDTETNLSAELVAQAVGRNEEFMRRASDMLLASDGSTLTVRVINQTGHKLPTGHLEGRRMWINVKFFDAAGALVEESGAYDPSEAVLNHTGAKVYEAVVGLDEDMARFLNHAPGPSHLFPLNNMFYLDNRIPPRGFTNAGFARVQSAPVGYAYADGQYWDDTEYAVPPGAVRAVASLYYQTITREAVEGLRDANITNNAGQVLYDQWVATGKSAPVLMDRVDIPVHCAADCDLSTGVGALDIFDFLCFQNRYAAGDPYACDCDTSTGMGTCDIFDFLCFQNAFAAGCP